MHKSDSGRSTQSLLCRCEVSSQPRPHLLPCHLLIQTPSHLSRHLMHQRCGLQPPAYMAGSGAAQSEAVPVKQVDLCASASHLATLTWYKGVGCCRWLLSTCQH